MGLRTRRGLALAASLAFVISACTPGASQTPAAPSGGTESTAPSASAGVTSDNFKFAVDGEPTYFSLAYTDLPTSWIVGLLYNGLYRIDDTLDVVPDIAAELPVQSADGLTWTVKLRDDVKWHDGTPVTADDVKFTFDLALSPNCTYIPDFCSAIEDNVESVTVVDPTTVELRSSSRSSRRSSSSSPRRSCPKAAVDGVLRQVRRGRCHRRRRRRGDARRQDQDGHRRRGLLERRSACRVRLRPPTSPRSSPS